MEIDDLQNFVSRGMEAQKAVNKILNEHEEKPMSENPNFRIVLQTGKYVLIEDVGPWDEYLTITNGVERVVQKLVSQGKVQAGQRLFYVDSEKQMDEIEFNVVDGFQRFKPVNIQKDETALEVMGAWTIVAKRTR